MKSGWKTKRLGDLCAIELGKTPARAIAAYWDQDRKSGNVWLSIADLLNAEDRLASDSKEYLSAKGAAISKVVLKGTLLVSFKLTLGRLAFAGRDLYTNEAIAALTLLDKHELSKDFLFYFMHFFDWVKAAENDVKLKGMTLNKAKLKEILVHFPQIPEQRRIVAILDEAFVGIAKARANAEQNLSNARELFESHLQSVFARAEKDWPIVDLADLAGDITDGDHMPPPKSSEGVPFITISNINKQTHSVDFDDTFMVSDEYFRRLKPNKKPRKGDVLYTVTGSFGIPVRVEHDNPFCFQRHIGLVRPNSETTSAWLYYLLLSPQAFDQADVAATGTAQKTVSLKVLRSLKVPRVPLAEQHRLTRSLDALSTETRCLATIYQQKLVALDELRQSLLARAFAGDL